MAEPIKPVDALVIYDSDPRNLPPEYLQAIGLVVAASAQTESIMQTFIGALLGIDNINTIALTAHMVAPLKDHIARTLIELNTRYTELVDRVDDLLDSVNDALAKRNTIVHNAFSIHPATKEILSRRLKARGSLQLELRPVSVEELMQDALLIYEVGMEVMRLMLELDIVPSRRSVPLNEPLNRSKKARDSRRDLIGGK